AACIVVQLAEIAGTGVAGTASKQEVKPAVVVIVSPGHAGIIDTSQPTLDNVGCIDEARTRVLVQLANVAASIIACEEEVEPAIIVVVPPGHTAIVDLGQATLHDATGIHKGCARIVVQLANQTATAGAGE